MKLGRRVEARVFVKEGEDEEKIKNALLSLFPFNLQEEKIALSKSTAESFEHRKIRIYTALLQKDRHINAFIRKFFARLTPEQKSLLKGQLDSRVDDELNFFIRLDKEKLLDEGIFWITDSGNCFHVKVGIAAFPSKKEVAKKIVEKLLEIKENNKE